MFSFEFFFLFFFFTIEFISLNTTLVSYFGHCIFQFGSFEYNFKMSILVPVILKSDYFGQFIFNFISFLMNKNGYLLKVEETK